MGAADIDRLEIEVEAQATKANRALDALVSKLEKLSSSVGKVNGSDLVGFANGVDKICKSSAGMSNIKTADFTRLAKNIEKIASISPASLNASSSAIGVMAKQLSSFGAASANATAIGEIAKNISKLGNKGVVNAIDNMPRFATALSQTISTLSKAPKVSGNLVQMTNALANLAVSVKGTQSATSKTGESVNKLSQFFNALTSSTNKSSRSFRSFSQLAGAFYANFYSVLHGIQRTWKAVLSSMDYVETFNYWNVALDKIGTEFGNQFEQYGYDSAEAYANSFSDRLKSLTLKMTGYSIGDSGNLTLTDNKNLGLDPEQLMNYQAKIVSVTNAVGLCGETSTNTAKALSMLAADMSSYTNEDLSSVMTNFQSGLIGQSRALYKFGIDITNATLQQYAYNLGVTKSLSSMSQSEKMQLRLIAILDQSKVAWGDQANTLGSVANQYRIMKQQIANLGRTIGNLFLPIVKNVLPVVNALIMALNRLFTTLGFHFFGDNWLKDLQDGTSKGYGSGVEDLGEDADDTADSLNDAANAAKKLKDVTLGIDELNINNPNSDSGSSSSSGSGKGNGIDLSDEIANALADYESVWDKAFAESENKAQKIADAICSAFERGDYEGIGTYISNGISSALEKINWKSVYGVANNFGTGLAQFLNGLITPRLFGDVGKTIAGSLNTAIYAALSFGETFDWSNLGESIASGVNEFFRTFDFKSMGRTLNVWVQGLFNAIRTALKKVKWSDVWKGIADFVGELDVDTVAILIGAFALKYAGKLLTSAILKSVITSKLSSLIGGSSLSAAAGSVGSAVAAGFAIAATVYVSFKFVEDAKNWIQNIKDFGWDEGRKKSAEENTANPYKNGKAVTQEDGSGPFDSWLEKLEKWQAKNRETRDAEDKEWGELADSLSAKLSSWWTNDVTPWFTKEKWQELGENIKSSLSTKWSEFGDWWSGTGVPDWWDENVSPWFTKEKWSELGQNTKDGLSTKWNEFSQWWGGTGVPTWWNNNVSPWFTKEKWRGASDGMQQGLQEKWNEFTSWWQNTGVYKWWKENVSPWFTREKWSSLGSDAKSGLESKWNEFTSWWSNTGFAKWWSGVESKFSSDSWSFSGIKDGLSSAWNAAIETLKSKWNSFAEWLNAKLTIKIDTSTVIGSGIKSVLGTDKISLGNIPMFADGGFPETGQLFMARENGINEMVGQIGSHHAVANNDQIVAGIKNGVYQANEEQNALLREQNSLLKQLLEKDTSVNIGDRDIARANERGRRSMGLTLRTT
ncbi:hypothetical protein [Roseburia sp. 831b]|uniref:hypothetical protein n=1 Tax=Roseburia sp. 831b TaxID=1261635 RepID=UPI000951BD62|nr:hypothetical protein [Roseburia sp. 831b]WVK74287.1 hypothetical protein BIV16_07150 [Roseburia sp. 831b]